MTIGEVSKRFSKDERLIMLIDACSDVIKACTKIQKHGDNSYHPMDPDYSNSEYLEDEIRDMMSILNQMHDKQDYCITHYPSYKIWDKKLEWTSYQ